MNNHKLLVKKLALLEKLVIKDELTGLYNYRHFCSVLIDEIYRAKRYNRPLCLLIIDIDYLKKINDKKGHKFGDNTIKKLANILLKNVRKSSIVCRYGGDEFVIILPETKIDNANNLAKRLYKIINKKTNFKISIGISSFPKDGKTPKSLFNSADKRLYKIKNNRRDINGK